MKRDIDYTLYLVTDRELMSAPTIESAVESAVKGGCTLVQLREKTASSLEFLQVAQAVKQITDRYNVPLIINDRVDIALAVDADGVHVGQSDIPAGIVRKMIGQDKILGVSASCLGEALAAVDAGADYLGVGAMFATGTKTDAEITSMEELRKIREEVCLPIVVIGGINKQTAPMFCGGWIDGLAVVSAVLSQPDIEAAAAELKALFSTKTKADNIEAVIFDMDGTLIDSMGVWKKIDIEFLGKRGIDIPADYADDVCGYTFREAADYTIKRFGLSETIDSLINEWNDMALHEYGHNVALKPYAREYLEALKARGIKLGIATSMPSVLCEPVLSNNGITQFFDAICFTDEVKRGKEFSDVFRHAADKMNTLPENCMVFEDLPQAVLSAKRLGMTVYGVYDETCVNWEKIKRIADGAIYDFRSAPTFD